MSQKCTVCKDPNAPGRFVLTVMDASQPYTDIMDGLTEQEVKARLSDLGFGFGEIGKLIRGALDRT